MSPGDTKMDSDTFSLTDYDGIGFDLDCTLAEYNVKELVKLVYNLLATHLVRKKSYDPEFLLKPLEEGEYFLQKGLFMDLRKGNILKIDENGKILKAAHGTASLSNEEILSQYGPDKCCSIMKEFIRDPSLLMNKQYENMYRATLDCFDMSCTLLFARVVDSLDSKNEKPLKEYDIWCDILSGLYQMYSKNHFSTGESEFFSALKSNPSLYYKKWPPEKLAWLKEVKSKKFVFLLTGSFIDFAELTAGYCIGEDWKEYFDIILCYARKPHFFSEDYSFLAIENFKETDSVIRDLKRNSIYSQGNWKELNRFISKELNISIPKCLYFGDNLFLDVYAPVHFKCCDSVSVSLELKDEYRSSWFWGSYFEGTTEKNMSYWNSLIKMNAVICVSSLDVFVNKPLNFQYSSLKSGKDNSLDKINGYYIN